ncbi:MAG: DUF1361 domain-containing protein [Acidimicrobiia bacterium]
MYVLLGNGPWMAWNAFLALIPLGFAVFLFTGPRRAHHRPLWWLGVVVFFAFLPNGPYVITDLIHLKHDALGLRGNEAANFMLAFQYAAFIAVGLAAYAGSLELLRRYVLSRGWTRSRAFVLELALHAMCSVGVLLGRFARFNSWELGTRPDDIVGHAVSRFDRPASWLLLFTTFGVITAATCFLRFTATGFVGLWHGARRD